MGGHGSQGPVERGSNESPGARIRVGAALSMVLLLLLATFASLALGDEQDAPGSVIPAGVDSPSELATVSESGKVDLPSTDPQAAEELPHSDLNRPEAEDLLEGVFGGGMEDPALPYDELEVEEFRSDYIAVVAPPEPEGDAGLLSSLLPLRAETESGDKELVDLSLERSGDHLEPDNPLVEVEIPEELSEGIALPNSDITISIGSGETDRTASEFNEASAFFPNVRLDSDLVVSAVPTGIETFTHLRTPDAPHSEVFELSLPPGAQLESTGVGGARVNNSEGEQLLTVSAPAAIDAEGDEVPATLEVDGHRLAVSVDPPTDAVYPILLDPVFESYNWNNGVAVGKDDWEAATQPGFTAYTGGWGLDIGSNEGPTSPGYQGQFNYHVPRYYLDKQGGYGVPSSYIRKMNFWNVNFSIPGTGPYDAYPFVQMGLWSEAEQQFVSSYTRMGTEGKLTDPNWVYPLVNANNNVAVKHGGVALATFNSWNGPSRHLTVMQASVEISDNDSPEFKEIGGVSEWVDSAQGSALKYRATDTGLGIHRIGLHYPGALGGRGYSQTGIGCFGTASYPCPREANSGWRPVSYNPALMPQGENWVSLEAIDPVDHTSPYEVGRIKVDHTAPEVAPSGSLTEQASVGTKLPSYTLSYNAADGDEAAAAPLTQLGSAGTGIGQLESPVGVAVDANGNVWASDLANRKLVLYSKAGAVIREIKAVSPTADLRGVAVGPEGNLWVADRASKAIVKLSPTGTLLGSVTTAAMSEPWGVAFGPEGAMWVSDPGAHRLFKFQGSELKASVQDPRLSWPIGITVDRFGNVWTAQQSPHRVLEFNSSGNFIFEFGSEGTANGQLSWPTGIAIAKSGHIFVADAGNGRIQVFNTGGDFLRSFATPGSQTNQLNGPRELAVGASNSLYVVDLGNKRIATWSHADKDPQSGVTKLEIKVDGVARETRSPGCATKNCVISGSWTMNADNYPVGKHKVDMIATDGVGRTSTKTFEVETHGDLTAPAVALSGSMTEQSTLGTTRPSYKLKTVATDPGSAEERQSGVASTSIKVDGTLVDSATPGCTTGGCSITREWTLNSNSYAPGAHTVEVKAMDATGRWTNKTFSINIARDTTAPTFATLDPFYTAPDGWLEQKTYRIQSLVTDTNGYGVTSVQLKVDGAVVLSAIQTCSAGGCSRTFGSEPPINMNLYGGGAHPAELIASDGAGNVRKRAWTINVNPDGTIALSEATDTLEAVEATAPEAVELTPAGGLVVDAPGEEGSNPQLIPAEGELHSDGSPTPVTVDTSAKDGFAVETTGLPEDGSTSEGTIEVVPVQVNPGASPAEVTDGSAAIISNSSVETDTVLRPIYDGLQNFQAIRSAVAPEQYSWRVNMEPDQYLISIDSRNAAVFWENGPQAMLIRAPDAHGADGKAVSTSVSVSEGNVVTLTVHHRVSGVVYPVVAGLGWEGGFVYTSVAGPPAEVFEEQSPANLETLVTYEIQVGPPELVPASEADGEATASSASQERRRKFVRSVCGHSAEWWETNQGGETIAEGKIRGFYCGNSWDPVNQPGKAVLWRGNMRGAFFYTPGVKVRHNYAIACAKGIPTASRIKFYAMKEAYECHYGPKTSDGNGGVHADAGHYLRAQAHWELGQRGKCYGNQPSEECTPPDTCWEWMDRALELHLWPSGNIDPIKLLVAPPPGNC